MCVFAAGALTLAAATLPYVLCSPRLVRHKSVVARFVAVLLVFAVLTSLACGSEDKAVAPPKETAPAVTEETPPPKYDFEDSLVVWIPQDYKDSRACTAVKRSAVRAKHGSHSLEMAMDLVAKDGQRAKGEAWVDMLQHPPLGLTAPLNLEGRVVTAWVYAPPGSAGDPDAPNGFQVFVKDATWKGEYGKWTNVEEARWVRVSLKVSAQTPPGGWMAEGFNPTEIIAVGVKMGAGGASTARYKGPVFIDAVDW